MQHQYKDWPLNGDPWSHVIHRLDCIIEVMYIDSGLLTVYAPETQIKPLTRLWGSFMKFIQGGSLPVIAGVK